MPEAHRRCENSTPAQRERHEKLQEGTTLARRRAREFLFRVRQLRHALGRLPLPLVLLALAATFAWVVPWLHQDHTARRKLLADVKQETVAIEAARNASARTVGRGDILQFVDLDKRSCRISELRRVRKRISVVEKSLAAQRAQDGSGGELLALMRAGRDTVPATLRLLETEVRNLLTQNASCVYYYGDDGIPDEEDPADAPPAPPESVDSRTIDDLLMRKDAGREDVVPSDAANR